MITLKTTWFLTLFSTQKAMLTPSSVLAYWMRGSMAGILYASGLSLSRYHWMDRAISRRWLVRQEALAAVAAIVRLGWTAVNGALALLPPQLV